MMTLIKLLQKFLIKLNKPKEETLKWLHAFYKVFFQPQFGFACKFHPSCSCYAKQSYQQHNLVKATIFTLWRISRCHPLSRGGFDPVPNRVERIDG